MKSSFILLLFVPFWGTLQSSLVDITQAIGNGNADKLGMYFDDKVEVAVLDQEDVYNKTQAVGVVKGFFSKNQPRSFSQVHQGTSPGKDSEYCIGNLVTNGATFRVYIYMKVEGNKHFIQELRFDKE